MSSKATDTQSQTQQTQPSQRGLLYVVSSPSGGGKGTLIRRVLDVVPNRRYSVGATRAPRNEEVNGASIFVDRKRFEEMVAAGDSLVKQTSSNLLERPKTSGVRRRRELISF